MMGAQQRVLSYACDAVSGCSLDRVTAVSRFDSGERHAVYRISYVDPAGRTADIVVRVSTGGDATERAQATREATVLEKVQGVAAPLLYDFRVESPWFDGPTMCMQFVPGEERDLVDIAPKDV